MKRLSMLILCAAIILCGCSKAEQPADLAATTLPVYEFTTYLCRDTDLTVTMLVTESVSCLHDYSLKPAHMRAIEGADAVILSGAGLEEFMEDALVSAHTVIDASTGLALLEGEHHRHGHDHHAHSDDPHIWLSPANAMIMAENICNQLIKLYPQYEKTFRGNCDALTGRLAALQAYADTRLQNLRCRELITFHDGFSYMAESFGLTVLKAVEEESGSEASAAALIEITKLVQQHGIPAIFTEVNGSTAAAQIICAETGVKCYALDMAMSGTSYFDAMYRNIDTLWEALQ